MKKILILLATLCCMLPAYAQLSARKTFTLRIKDLPKQSPVTTEVDSGQVFYVQIDTAGLKADTLRMVTLLLQRGDSAASDYTGRVAGDSFVLSGAALKLRFMLCHVDTAGKCTRYEERNAVFTRKAASGPTAVPAINSSISALANEKDDNRPVGYFTLKTGVVPVSGDCLDTNTVKSVEIALENGAIAKRGLVVTLSDGRKFVNRSSPISLARFAKRNADKLYCKDPGNTWKYIEVGHAIDYDYLYKFSYPEDGYYSLGGSKLHDTLKVGASINQLIEVRVYTDLLGLLGRKANGLIQTEITGNFISNTTNLCQTDIIFHTFVRPYFRLSKFDSKFGSLDTAHIVKVPGKADEVNRVYLNQIAYLQAGIKTNIVRFGIGVNQEIFLNFGLDINLVNGDSLYQKDITFINYYPEVEYRINRLSNFGLEFGARHYWQYLTKTAPFSNKGSEQILHFYSTINYYPFSNTNSKIYIRFSGFTSVTASDYSFSQFQFGVKTGLFAAR